MQISDAEWLVMNLIWDEQPLESKQVIARLGESTDWSAATIKTMLHRLVKKGALTFETEGKRYLYQAHVKRRECVRQASRSFLQRVFSGQAAPALLHLVRDSQLTHEEVAQIRELLNAKDQGND